jgi:hypothetical protein
MRVENSESFESVSHALHPSWRCGASEVTITRTTKKQQGMCARSFGTETWSDSYIEYLGLAISRLLLLLSWKEQSCSRSSLLGDDVREYGTWYSTIHRNALSASEVPAVRTYLLTRQSMK